MSGHQLHRFVNYENKTIELTKICEGGVVGWRVENVDSICRLHYSNNSKKY